MLTLSLLFFASPAPAPTAFDALTTPTLPGAPGLALDGGRIAVRTKRGGASLAATLALAGLDPDLAQPWTIEGWWLASFAEPNLDGARLRTLVAALNDPLEDVFAAPVFAGPTGMLAFPTDELLVGLPAYADADGRLSELGEITARDPKGSLDLVRIACRDLDGFAILEAAHGLARHPDVAFAEPDCVFTGRSAVGDPLFEEAWGLHNSGQLGGILDLDVDAPQAWTLTSGEAGVYVVVLDDGVELDHPDLAVVAGSDFTGSAGGGAPVGACDRHGTAVAGTISAIVDNDLGSAGLAPACRVASARVVVASPACDGTFTTQSSWTVDALVWAQSIGARVTCNSNVYAVTSAAVELEYAQARAAGVVHVAAAGDGGGAVGWPASLPDVLAVTAATRAGLLAPGSASGPAVALCAPGVDVWTTDRTGADGYGPGDHVLTSGSSIAAGYVAAAAALLASRNSLHDPDDIEQALLQSAVDLGAPGTDDQFGAGLLNAWQALLLASPVGATTRVNIGSDGAPSDLSSFFPSLSADGRYVAFDSNAKTLVPGDTNNKIDGFWRDRLTGETIRISIGPGGVQGDDSSGDVDLSADGRYVAFDSDATNLVAGDTNEVIDAFVHDVVTGVTERVSVPTGGSQADDSSFIPAISGDGRYVVFRSKASDLVPNDTNASDDAFVRDRLTDTTTIVSVGDQGQLGNGFSVEPEISDDGTVVSFMSLATNLVPNDTNGQIDVFVRDLVAGTTELVSRSTAGVIGNGPSANSALSADGRFVVFESIATNLVAGDTNGVKDVFLHDRTLGTTIRVTQDPSGFEANGMSELPWISSDGRFVAFYSSASNLVPGDTNGLLDVFVKDLATGEVELVSIDGDGNQGTGTFTGATQLALSRDGRFVAYESRVGNLVPGDTNGEYDIFVRDRMTTGGWFDLASGLPGTLGTPELSAIEGLEAAGSTELELTGALPGVPGGWVFGISELYLPLFAGTMVPSLDYIVLFTTDGAGTVTRVQPWPVNLPTGLDVRVQAWVLDPGGALGFAASNALGSQGP